MATCTQTRPKVMDLTKPRRLKGNWHRSDPIRLYQVPVSYSVVLIALWLPRLPHRLRLLWIIEADWVTGDLVLTHQLPLSNQLTAVVIRVAIFPFNYRLKFAQECGWMWCFGTSHRLVIWTTVVSWWLPWLPPDGYKGSPGFFNPIKLNGAQQTNDCQKCW